MVFIILIVGVEQDQIAGSKHLSVYHSRLGTPKTGIGPDDFSSFLDLDLIF